MEYGTFVGLTWGGLFFSYVEGIAGNNGMLMMLCFMLCGVSIFLPFLLAFRLNRKMKSAGESLTYFQGLVFAFSMFMYACLMNGLVVFAYFQLMDDGQLMDRMNELLTQPEMVSTYEQMGMGEHSTTISSSASSCPFSWQEWRRGVDSWNLKLES